MQISPLRLALATAISLALAASLSACGGGGNVRPDSPPQTADTCASSPGAPSCQQTTGGPSPSGVSAGSVGQYPADNQLVPTHVIQAQADGYTGKGVKVALMDSGIDPALAPFKNLTIHFQDMLLGGNDAATTASDATGHGSLMAQTLAGEVTSNFVGGIAPDVDLYVGQICSNSQGGCGVSPGAAQTFFNAGVRLFNYSLGDTSESASDPAFEHLAGGFQSVVDGGSLLVWSAGNSGADKLSAYAAAPSTVPGLASGWIAAVNVTVGGNGEVGGLDATSAQCGAAAQWCLAAPGYVQFVPIPGSDFTTGLADGTSTSAAVISGVAALVWQAFPWMNGHNVQQTVLTTATHLGGGDPTQPNATYGWGLVDAAKAVHGPAQFVGNFDADLGDDRSTFSNVISGSGSLILDGNADGALTLSAANTWSGGTTIHGGSLHLTGSLASNVTLDGGALAGDGTVNASVDNVAGTLTSLNAKVGQGLSISGNYTAGANSTTAVALGHPLTVGQTASLAGTLAITPPESSYAPKATETLLTAGKVSGTFATTNVSQLTFYTASVAYTGTRVTATTARKAVTQSVSQASPVVAAASRGLDNALAQADVWSQRAPAQHTTFLSTAAQFLGAQGQAQAMASVRSLSGEIHGTVGAIEAVASNQIDHAVSVHQAVASADGQPAFWVQGFSSDSGLSETGYASARSQGHGELVGLDIPVTDRFSGGLLVGQGRSVSHLDSLAGRATERDMLGGAYADYQFDGGNYLAARATWTHAKWTVNRGALIGSRWQKIDTARTDGLGRLALEAGKTFGAFTPYLGLAVLRQNQGSFTEQGAGGFGLTADSHQHTVTLANLGVRWRKSFDWAGGHSLLTGYAAWQRVLSGANLDFAAALVGAPTAAFTVTGQSLVRNVGQVGATLDTRINQRWDWYANLNAQGAANRYHAFDINAGVRYRF